MYRFKKVRLIFQFCWTSEYMIAIHYYATKGEIRVYHEPELDGGTGFGQIPIPRRLGVDNSCCDYSLNKPS